MRPDLVMQFHPPADPVSMNDKDPRGLMAAPWRAAGYYYWCEAHPGVGPSGRAFGVPGDITVILPFKTNRRRDPINFAQTVKHLVDGFVDAGAWPDDTLEYCTQPIPELYVGKTVVVRVKERV